MNRRAPDAAAPMVPTPYEMVTLPFFRSPPKATDAEIQAWADRHDLGISSITDLRCIFEDARSLVLKETPK